MGIREYFFLSFVMFTANVILKESLRLNALEGNYLINQTECAKAIYLKKARSYSTPKGFTVYITV